MIDIEKSIFICDESLGLEADCPPNFPYKYKHSCLRKCSDTFNDYFTQTRHFEDTDLGKIRTYSLIKSDGKKKCVEDCTNDSESDKNYYDLETYTCIGNCTETSKKYINGNQCVNSCDGIMNLLLNINQLKIKYAMTIAPNFQIFFIMIKTKSNAILNVVLILILDIF